MDRTQQPRFQIQMGVLPQGKPIDLQEVAVLLQARDDVAIARLPLAKDLHLRLPNGRLLVVGQRIQAGHKLALREIEQGQPVLRYGSIIGFATQTIMAGSHVHTHNLAVGTLHQEYVYGSELHLVQPVSLHQQRTFQGYRRPDGRIGTRNYLALIGTVNCASSTIRAIQKRFGAEILRRYPQVDGIIGLTHKNGCAMGSQGITTLQRVLAGMAAHPNVGAYLLVGLGCESNQIPNLISEMKLDVGRRWKDPLSLNLQEHQGIAQTVEEGARLIGELLPQVNDVQREAIPISELTLALQCGGSDGWSGVTANPALGYCVDELVRQGGTAVLSETPEIYGAEHVLLRRARSQDVGDKLLERLRWWEQYAAINGMEMDNNPSPGNKLGGLTTIYEKSLGAIAKGGSTPLNAVYQYAEPIAERGLVVMDTPGYDPVSVTGQVAGGANIVAFTTGRGSCFGFKPAPSIKIATNTSMYESMSNDMDLNAGIMLDGEGVSAEAVGRQILEEVIAVASGKKSKSEAQDIGEEEFAPWILGAIM